MPASTIDLSDLRAQFPALQQVGPGGQPFAFFDGPAGTQVPAAVIEAMQRYFLQANANTHGWFETSRRSQATVDAARAAMADLVGGAPEEIVFGPNMTTLTFAMSRALGRSWRAGDEVIVTRLDHDANVTPWAALAEQGIVVRRCDVRVDDCTLDLASLESQLGARTRLVAVGHASNLVGTINPVRRIARLAHDAGAQVWVDAVHSAPHLALDAGALGADYLVCSAYKFYGPHVGVLWGRRELLERLQPYKLRPAPDAVPERFESGTQCFEGLAGVTAAVDYLAAIGRRPDACEVGVGVPQGASARRADLARAFATIAAWERPLAAQVLEGLRALPAARVYGIDDPARLGERCPTIAFRLEHLAPAAIAQRLAAQGICVWDGNNYALGLTERLGLEAAGGMVRIGIVHTNTPAEVERLLAAIQELR